MRRTKRAPGGPGLQVHHVGRSVVACDQAHVAVGAHADQLDVVGAGLRRVHAHRLVVAGPRRAVLGVGLGRLLARLTSSVTSPLPPLVVMLSGPAPAGTWMLYSTSLPAAPLSPDSAT